MLKFITGELDMASGAVLVAMFLGATIFCTTWIAQRRSRIEIDNDFELAKLKQHDLTSIELVKYHDMQERELKKIESGLITSHRSNDD